MADAEIATLIVTPYLFEMKIGTLIVLLVIAGVNQLCYAQYAITGLTSDMPDSAMVLLKNVEKNLPFDTTYVRDGVFHFSGKVDGCEKFFIRYESYSKPNSRLFFVENTDITIDARGTNLFKARISGGKVQAQSDELDENISELRSRYDSLRIARINEKDRGKLEKIRSEWLKTFDQLKEAKISFISAHPDYEYCAYVLTEMKRNLANTKAAALFNGLSETVKACRWGQEMSNHLEKSVDFKEGAKTIDFTLNDLNGNSINLYSFHGKFVFLDFWASWCGVCREKHPYYRTLSQKYKDKGFEIVSVSLDTDVGKWRKAVEKDNITWTSLIDTSGMKGDIAVTYKIFGLPTGYLLDKNGIVIERITNGMLDEKRLIEILE